MLPGVSYLLSTVMGCVGASCRGLQSRCPPASVQGLIVELLCFCVVHHGYRMKYFVLGNNLVGKVQSCPAWRSDSYWHVVVGGGIS